MIGAELCDCTLVERPGPLSDDENFGARQCRERTHTSMPLSTHPVTSIAPEAQSEEDFVALGKLGGDVIHGRPTGITSPSSALLSRFR
jgi:hypothetical protein